GISRSTLGSGSIDIHHYLRERVGRAAAIRRSCGNACKPIGLTRNCPRPHARPPKTVPLAPCVRCDRGAIRGVGDERQRRHPSRYGDLSRSRQQRCLLHRQPGLAAGEKDRQFDDPSTWHLYYGDEVGRPGTALTFFAWGEQQPSGRNGNGMATETAFIIPESSLGYWAQRLIERDIAHEAPEKRFGERVLPFRDADGMRLALVAVKGADEIPGWSNGDVPAEHALRGFRGVTLMVAAGEPTAEVLTGAFGFQATGREGHLVRYRAGSDRLATVIDVRTAGGFLAGRQGTGSVHHVAFRAATDAAQADMVATLRTHGLHPTDQIDRCYFRSVYFREPGGVLFEIATDQPGFTVDEAKGTLGAAVR